MVHSFYLWYIRWQIARCPSQKIVLFSWLVLYKLKCWKYQSTPTFVEEEDTEEVSFFDVEERQTDSYSRELKMVSDGNHDDKKILNTMTVR